jgi:hypothetical protein
MAKNEVEYLTKGVEASRVKLMNQFEEWYQRHYSSMDDTKIKSPTSARGDRLDDGEKFELLEEERVRREDPESFAFFRAKKKSNQFHNTSKTSTVKMPPINKRR